MKKAISILLIAILVAALSACTQAQTESLEAESVADSAPESSGDGDSASIAEEVDWESTSQEPDDDAVESDASEQADGAAELQQITSRESSIELSRPQASSGTSSIEATVSPVPAAPVPGSDGMYAVNITVGSQVFAAKFYDNASVRVLIEQMPITLDMRDYASQEKVISLDYDFPSATKETPSTIRAGDLYLWSGDSLVLFYTTFSNSYSYVPIGYIEDPTGLASALGDGNVSVSFGAL